jgi:carbon-monoxide dehydrogenase large subunit
VSSETTTKPRRRASAKARVPYVGRPLPRVEDRPLLVGAGGYVDDFERPGMLHAHVVRSEVAHGRIRSIDVAAARRLPGVEHVITAADLPPVEIPVRLFPTDSSNRTLQPPLARDRVRYVGEPVAVVVATDPYLAEDAAAQVAVDVEPLVPVLDVEQAADDDAWLLHPQLGTNVIDRVTVGGDEAEVARLIRGADVVVRKRFRLARQGAVPLETRGLLAEYDADANALTVWGAAKVKHFNRTILSDLIGLPEASLRLIEGDVGGGFGARGEFYPEDYLIPWLAREIGRPVKWIEDRRENLLALNHSREQQWDLELAADREGRFIAFRASVLWAQGAYSRTHGSVLLPRLILLHASGPYRWQAFWGEASSVLTNKTPAGTYRGPGQYEPTFVRERMVDLVAREVGIDPAEIRRRNIITKAEMPYDSGLLDLDTGLPMVYDDGDFPLVFEQLLERCGYDQLRADVVRRQRAGERVGLSATSFIEMGNPGVFEQARVEALPDGRFVAHVGIASVGQGVETVLSQVAADLLHVPIEQVAVRYRDTATVPEGQGAFSSRATVWGGYAVAGAIRALQERAVEVAAERFNAVADEIEADGDSVLVPRGRRRRRVPIAELASEGFFRYEPGSASHVLTGGNVALVRVDPGSGDVVLERWWLAYEVGRAINPLTLEGQVRGAAVQGIGGALLEAFAYAPDGQPLTTSFLDYALPTAAESPNVEVLLVELGERREGDPLSGAKGGGEGGIIGVGATVANAVADALGGAAGELTELPILPETVQRLAALQAPAARGGAKPPMRSAS